MRSARVPDPFHIPRNLDLECFNRGELDFIAQFSSEHDFQFLALEFGFHVQEMGFDAQGCVGGFQGGAGADIDDGGPGFGSPEGLGGVDAFGRQDQAARFQVRRGKAELMAQMVAGHDTSRHRVGASQHLAGEAQVPPANSFADSGAADGFVIQRNGGQAVHRKSELFAQPPEQTDIPAPLMAKSEIGADAKALDRPQIPRQPADERLTRLLAESLVKMEQQQRLRPERLNRPLLLREGINQRRHMFRGDDTIGMAIEGDHQRQACPLGGVGHGLPYDLLVAQVNAIEEADGQANPAVGRTQFLRIADNFQLNRRIVESLNRFNAVTF
jgi:hypothetical protein